MPRYEYLAQREERYVALELVRAKLNRGTLLTSDAPTLTAAMYARLADLIALDHEYLAQQVGPEKAAEYIRQLETVP